MRKLTGFLQTTQADFKEAAGELREGFVSKTRLSPGAAMMWVVAVAVTVGAWVQFLSDSRRRSVPVIAVVILGAFLALLTLWVILGARRETSLIVLVVRLTVILTIYVTMFADVYYNFGTTDNFNYVLRHGDALYMVLGTLTTAGTGALLATSRTGRSIQTVQMVSDLPLMLLAFGVIVTRLTKRH